MREIKFRAWDLDFEKMWLPHSSCYEYLKHKNQQASITAFMNPKFCHLMQYTGLKDKNGIEIYEGDILEKETYDEQEYYMLQSVVVWDHACFRLKTTQHHDRNKIGIIYSLPNAHKRQIDMPKIIGNSYENPELLKNQKEQE